MTCSSFVFYFAAKYNYLGSVKQMMYIVSGDMLQLLTDFRGCPNYELQPLNIRTASINLLNRL